MVIKLQKWFVCVYKFLFPPVLLSLRFTLKIKIKVSFLFLFTRYLTNVSYLSVGENDLTQLPDEIGMKPLTQDSHGLTFNQLNDDDIPYLLQ